MCVCALHACLIPEETLKKGIGSPGIGITESCELPCRCWGSKLGPMEEREVFLPGETSFPVCEISCANLGTTKKYRNLM